MDLAEVKKRFDSRVAVVGKVDVDLLCRGSVAQVRAATTSAVRPENFLAVLKAARE